MQINDLIVSKLSARWPNHPAKSYGDLWASYSAQVNGGSVQALTGLILVPAGFLDGQALYDHYGGPEIHFADRQYRFWTNFVP